MNNRYTFWQLIQENTIEIPIIQRDYAQGRTTPKETKIRENFLDALYKKIDESIPINLDFVYGRIEKTILTPLDGQQRLTTLFLLHWYLSVKDSKLEEYKNILSKFTYKTRVSSREFCKALVTNSIELEKQIEVIENGKLITKVLNISEIIENKNWFYQSWKKDPTIKSMLTMIDSIHKKFKDSTNLFGKLICSNNPPVTFDFLPLNEFKLTDELYVKMNARGKPLTDYEDFKAKFVELLSDDDTQKLDNSWTDLFWKHRIKNEKDGYYYIDDKFLNFFTNMTINFGIVNDDIDTKKKLDKINIIEIYEKVYENHETINNLVVILDKLVELNKANQLCNQNFDYFIEKKDLSYWDRAKFFTLSKYLLSVSDTDIDNNIFDNWTRVTNNIINNYNIDSVDKFKHVLDLIESMSTHIDNINYYLSLDDFISEKPQSFKTLEFQKYEEKVKAKLINNNEWKQAIRKAEAHDYLNGHITFLIDISNTDLTIFKKYYEKFDNYFQEDKENFLFQRALLTKGDYSVMQGRNYSFCSFDKSPRGKDDNWKEVFHDDEKQIYLKELLDDDRLLTEIIDQSNILDWRKGFIKYPQLLSYCKKYKIRWHSEEDILLLSGERVYGQHAEYYTYLLYFELLHEYGKQCCEYHYSNSTDEDKFISFRGNTVSFKNNQWYLNDNLVSNKQELLNKIKLIIL